MSELWRSLRGREVLRLSALTFDGGGERGVCVVLEQRECLLCYCAVSV